MSRAAPNVPAIPAVALHRGGLSHVPLLGVPRMYGDTRMSADAIRQLALPKTPGPWSYRVFYVEQRALEFYDRLAPEHPAPFRLDEDRLAPDGCWLSTGTWVVLYRVFE